MSVIPEGAGTVNPSEEARLGVVCRSLCRGGQPSAPLTGSMVDRLLGLEVEHLSVDDCITKAPCGGQVAGPSPVDRRKQGLKRSVATETGGIPLAAVPAPANQRDDGAAGCHPGRRHRHWTAAQAAHGAPGHRLRLPALPGGAGGTGHGRPDRHARRAGTGPGGAPLGDRAHSRLGQPVRQAALVHRAPPAGGRVLAGAGPCGHYPGSPDPPCLGPLPLGRPSPPPPLSLLRPCESGGASSHCTRLGAPAGHVLCAIRSWVTRWSRSWTSGSSASGRGLERRCSSK
jgi:hypothetical protein